MMKWVREVEEATWLNRSSRRWLRNQIFRMDRCPSRNPLRINQGMKIFNRWDRADNTALNLGEVGKLKLKQLLRLRQPTKGQEQGKRPWATSFKHWAPFRKAMEVQTVLTISLRCCCPTRTCKTAWIITEPNWAFQLLISPTCRLLRILSLSIFRTINFSMRWTISKLRTWKPRARTGNGRARPRTRCWHRHEDSMSTKE